MWAVKEAHTTLDRGHEVTLVTLANPLADAQGAPLLDAAGNPREEIRVVRHYRSAGQTLTQWRANVKREIRAMLDAENTTAPTETDVTAAVR